MLPLSRRNMLAFLGVVLAPLPARAQSTKIRIGTSATESAGEPFFALDEGIFAKLGLDVELTFFANSAQSVVAASTGTIDVAVADPIQLGSAVNRGLPFVFFAGGSQSAKDLDGKTIGVVALNSVSSLAVVEWLHQNAVDPSAVRVFEMPIPTMAPALGRGTVTAAHISEPYLSAAKDEVRYLGKPYDAIAKHFYINAWFATRDWLAKDPATARRLSQAIYATAQWANAHHDASAPILAKYSKIELDRIRVMTRATFATSLDATMIQPVLDVAWRYHYLDKPIVAQAMMALPGSA